MKKVMIVITDGESQDPTQLPRAIMEADAKRIVRFTIGVSCIIINSILIHDLCFNSVEILSWVCVKKV